MKEPRKSTEINKKLMNRLREFEKQNPSIHVPKDREQYNLVANNETLGYCDAGFDLEDKNQTILIEIEIGGSPAANLTKILCYLERSGRGSDVLIFHFLGPKFEKWAGQEYHKACKTIADYLVEKLNGRDATYKREFLKNNSSDDTVDDIINYLQSSGVLP